MSRALRIVLIVLAAFALFEWWSSHGEGAPEVTGAAASHANRATNGAVTAVNEPDGANDDTTVGGYPEFLPPEAAATLQAIENGGPFPYARDGVVFENREHRLPERARGYYREYTVPTPGSADRGARRIVTGGDPPEVYYYTDDHYRSFRRVEIRR